MGKEVTRHHRRHAAIEGIDRWRHRELTVLHRSWTATGRDHHRWCTFKRNEAGLMNEAAIDRNSIHLGRVLAEARKRRLRHHHVWHRRIWKTLTEISSAGLWSTMSPLHSGMTVSVSSSSTAAAARHAAADHRWTRTLYRPSHLYRKLGTFNRRTINFLDRTSGIGAPLKSNERDAARLTGAGFAEKLCLKNFAEG